MALRGSAQVPGSLELAAQGLALQLSVYGAGGSVTFQASYPDVLLQGEWQNLVVSFDSQLDSVPAVFVDGVLEAAGSTSGSVAGFSDGARRVYLGTGAEGMAQPWQGRIGHTAVWDAALGDDEILVIALGGHAIDLAQPSGAYHGQDALLHYWKPGADPAAPGFDFGPASSPINLDDPAGNVDATDVAPDAPVLVQ
jgi:hypothetical protein